MERKSRHAILVAFIFLCLFSITDKKYEEVYAKETAVLDISECSVSPKNAKPGDTVSWKIKTLQNYSKVDIQLYFKTPTGKEMYVDNYWELEKDKDGYFEFKYVIPDMGEGDGEYQIYHMRIWNYDIEQYVDISSDDTDMSSLSIQINGQKKDITAPVIDKENIMVRCEKDRVYVDIPVIESESGIQESGYEIVYFDNNTNSWKTHGNYRFLGKGYANESGIVTLDQNVSEFKENIVYGIRTATIIDNAGNERTVNIQEYPNGDELNSIPEKWRFIVTKSSNDIDDDDNSQEDNTMLLDMSNSEVSSQTASAGDVITWNLKFADGYVPHSLNLVYPDGYYSNSNWYYRELTNWRLEDDGRYSCSFVVPIAGYNGLYKISGINCCKESGDGEIYTVNAKDSVYDGEYYEDLSSLYVNVEGLAEDTLPPSYDVNNMSIQIEEGNINVFVPTEDDKSGVNDIYVGWCYFDKVQNMWQPLQYGVTFESNDMEKTSGGYIGKYDLRNFLTIVREMWVDESIDIFGIGFLSITDEAGNKAMQIILPGYLSYEEEDKRVGLNAISEALRFVVEGNNTHEHSYSTEWTVDVAPTCEKKGSKSHHCLAPNCDSKSDITEISVTGQHTYGEWIITQEATVDSEGKKERVCTICGTKEYETITKSMNSVSDKANLSETVDSEKKIYKKGMEFSDGNNEYKIKTKNGKKGTVVYEGTNKKSQKIKIPKTVKVDDATYTVTEIAAKAFKGDNELTSVTIPEGIIKIGKNSFYGCKNLKTITIKSTNLKSVEKNAIKNINKNATIKVPKNLYGKYKKLFKSNTGYKKSMKIKK